MFKIDNQTIEERVGPEKIREQEERERRGGWSLNKILIDV